MLYVIQDKAQMTEFRSVYPKKQGAKKVSNNKIRLRNFIFVSLLKFLSNTFYIVVKISFLSVFV